MDPKKTLQQDYESNGFGKLFNELEPVGRYAVSIDVSNEHEGFDALGATRFGGLPDLPVGFQWPYNGGETDNPESGHPMAFVAQINLKEVHEACKHIQHLPKEGILYFFRQDDDDFGNYGLEAENFGHCKVMYYDGDPTELMQSELPEALSEYERYDAAGVKFTEVFSLPDSFSPWGGPIDDLDDDASDTYIDRYFNDPDGQLLGHPAYVQGAVEEEAATAAAASDDDDDLDPALKAALAAPFGREETDWRLLLQVGSVSDCDMMWGDAGSIYFMITSDDLAAHRFDRIICGFQCG